MAPFKQTAFRLDDTDYAILDAVKQHMGFGSRSDALRYVVRQYAREHAIETGPKPKRKAKK